jgi:hypothetical protein
MALDSGNVTVAVTGAVSLGTASAPSPPDADTVLGTGWTDLGYCSEAGIVEARSRSTNAIKAWQNASIVRTVVTEAGATWAVTFIESKQEVVELFYSDTVDASGAVDVNPGLTGGRQKFVIDVIDGDAYVRTYIPEGELVEAPGDQTSASGEPVGYSVTITGYPSTEINGASYRKWYSALSTGGLAAKTKTTDDAKSTAGAGKAK